MQFLFYRIFIPSYDKPKYLTTSSELSDVYMYVGRAYNFYINGVVIFLELPMHLKGNDLNNFVMTGTALHRSSYCKGVI